LSFVLFLPKNCLDKRDHHKDLVAALYQQIGQLKVEVDFLKKNQIDSAEVKRQLIVPEHPSLSIARQCELLGLARQELLLSTGDGKRRERNVDAFT
jgi:putative transposase